MALTVPKSSAMREVFAMCVINPQASERIFTLEKELESGKKWDTLSKIGIGAAVVVGGVSTILLAPLAIGAVGFGSAGVAAGSLAASYQSVFLGGLIAKGSLFALLQSAGATGVLSGTTLLSLGTVGGVTAGASGMAARSGLRAWFRNRGSSSREQVNQEEIRKLIELLSDYLCFGLPPTLHV